jgi:hypothetical protein
VASTSPTFAWQGWSLHLPAEWNAVKLEGTDARGEVLIADMARPRLAFRWTTPRRKLDLAAWAQRTLGGEIGKLAATEVRPFAMSSGDWRGSMLYVDSDPPGRDVWVAQSRASGRVIEMVYSSHGSSHGLSQGADRTLSDLILPSLSDAPADQSRLWRVFDLSCRSPAGYALSSQRLNAGDLTLSFANRRLTLLVRQIALGKLALQRKPLAKWLDAHVRSLSPTYAPADEARVIEIERGDIKMSGLIGSARLRSRFGWMRWLPPAQTALVLHDEPRDRLIVVQASEESVADEVAASVGR